MTKSTYSARAKRVTELFGVDTNRVFRAGELQAIVASAQCPYLEADCSKRRKDGITVLGTCSIQLTNRISKKRKLPSVAVSGKQAVAICPVRFLEKDDSGAVKIFSDVAKMMGSNTDDVKYVTELAVRGGRVDYVLFNVVDDLATNIVGLEFQTLDTTGSVWPARHDLLVENRVSPSLSLPVPTEKQIKAQYGLNWRMTEKTILVQLLHKVETFQGIGGKLVLAIQDVLWDKMVNDFNFSGIQIAGYSEEHVLHFFVYPMVESPSDEYNLGEPRRFSASIEQLADALNVVQSGASTLEEIRKGIFNKGKGEYHAVTETPDAAELAGQMAEVQLAEAIGEEMDEPEAQ